MQGIDLFVFFVAQCTAAHSLYIYVYKNKCFSKLKKLNTIEVVTPSDAAQSAFLLSACRNMGEVKVTGININDMDQI